jgi:hypothetical protein
MPDPFGPGTVLGYCTNVHPDASPAAPGAPGRTRIDGVQASLLAHACEVKDRVSPDSPLPIGLWLSAKAATQLVTEPARFEGFRDFLKTHGLAPFTFNAFPWGDFHGPEVKHRVYRPDWSEFERLEYTVAIAAIAGDLCPPHAEVSISTLPVVWGKASPGPEGAPSDLASVVRSLRSLARHLHRVEEDTGRFIHVDLEPEPGCYLDTAADVVRFFEDHLLPRAPDEGMLRRHIRVCHDVCHSAVMREDQTHALETYARAGIRVGKVQISAAIGVDLHEVAPECRRDALGELAAFAEGRYLHQTTVLPTGHDSGGGVEFFEDLPDALSAAADSPGLMGGSWRTHFHVPVFLDRIGGQLLTTSDQIGPAIEAARRLHDTRHFEVETYAWGVLPAELRAASLADGIAHELLHARSLWPGEQPA